MDYFEDPDYCFSLGEMVALLRLWRLIFTQCCSVCLSFCPRECLSWSGLWISGQPGIPVRSKGSFTIWTLRVCIIHFQVLRNLSSVGFSVRVSNSVHTWFSECKRSVSVYYPHYACHGLAVSLYNYSRIYLCLSPEGDPGALLAETVSGTMPGEHIILWKPHLWSVASCPCIYLCVRKLLLFHYYRGAYKTTSALSIIQSKVLHQGGPSILIITDVTFLKCWSPSHLSVLSWSEKRIRNSLWHWCRKVFKVGQKMQLYFLSLEE